MALSANQVPIQHWPTVACAYMHLRLTLSQPTAYMEAADNFEDCNSLVGSLVRLLNYNIPRTEADLKNFTNYLQNLLQEIEDELQ